MQLNEYLASRGLTVPKFGQRVGVHNRQTMYQYAKGIRFPPPDVLARIRNATDGVVTADDFVQQHETRAARAVEGSQASAA